MARAFMCHIWLEQEVCLSVHLSAHKANPYTSQAPRVVQLRPPLSPRRCWGVFPSRGTGIALREVVRMIIVVPGSLILKCTFFLHFNIFDIRISFKAPRFISCDCASFSYWIIRHQECILQTMASWHQRNTVSEFPSWFSG